MATLKKLMLIIMALMSSRCLSPKLNEFINANDKAIVIDKDTYIYSVWIGKVQSFNKGYKLNLTSVDLRDTVQVDVSSGIYEKHEIGDTIKTDKLWRH